MGRNLLNERTERTALLACRATLASLLLAGAYSEASACCVTITIPPTTGTDGSELYGNISVDENFNVSNPNSVRSVTIYFKPPGPVPLKVIHAPPAAIYGYSVAYPPAPGKATGDISFSVAASPGSFLFTIPVNSSFWDPEVPGALGWEVWRSLGISSAGVIPFKLSVKYDSGSLTALATAVPEASGAAMSLVGLLMTSLAVRRSAPMERGRHLDLVTHG